MLKQANTKDAEKRYMELVLMKTSKRLLTVVFVLILALMPIMSVAAFAGDDDQITVIVNGQPVEFYDQSPVKIDGRVLVPARGVFEKLGFEAHWNAQTQIVLLKGADSTIAFVIGQDYFTIFGAPGDPSFPMDVYAQIIGGRAMIPLRAVAEALGGTAEWDSVNRVATITTPLPDGAEDILYYAIISNSFVIGNHNPVFSTLADEGRINDFIFTSLLHVYQNNHFNNHGAAWFEYDVDDATFTIHFHEDTAMYWHDGVPVTMYDLEFAYEMIIHWDTFSQRFGTGNNTSTVLGIEEFWADPNVGISGIRVFNDGRSIEFSYESIDPSIRIGGVWTTPMPRHHFEGIPMRDIENHPNSRQNAIGNGAFMLVDSSEDSAFLLANLDYWRGAPKLDGINIQVVHPDVIILSLAAGDPIFFDIAQFSEFNAWQIEYIPNTTAVTVLERRLDFIGFRHGVRDNWTDIIIPNRDSYINCVYLRRALGYALDNETVAESIFGGLRFPIATTIIPWQGDIMYDGIEQGFSIFDIDKANAILDEAGYEWVDGEQFRCHNVTGEPFELVWLIANNFVENYEMVPLHQANWAKIGLNVVLFENRLVSLAERTEILNHDLDDGVIHLYYATWLVGSNPNPNGLWGNFAHNNTRYTSPEFDAILASFDSMQVWDMDRLREQFFEFQRYVYEQAPWIPITSGYQIWAVNDRVQNFSVDTDITDSRVPNTRGWHLWDLRRQP